MDSDHLWPDLMREGDLPQFPPLVAYVPHPTRNAMASLTPKKGGGHQSQDRDAAHITEPNDPRISKKFY